MLKIQKKTGKKHIDKKKHKLGVNSENNPQLLNSIKKLKIPLKSENFIKKVKILSKK